MTYLVSVCSRNKEVKSSTVYTPHKQGGDCGTIDVKLSVASPRNGKMTLGAGTRGATVMDAELITGVANLADRDKLSKEVRPEKYYSLSVG